MFVSLLIACVVVAADATVHVVYDDCCKLATYTLMREPSLFKEWRWFIDRLHFKGHIACAYSFDLESYPCFKEVNTEACEQVHSLLNKLRGQLAGMSQFRAAFFLRHFLFSRNVMKGLVTIRQFKLRAE